MKRIFRVLGLAMVLTAIMSFAMAGAVLAAGNGHMESAPESGDGISNGSGFDDDAGTGLKGAPNSGDGFPDGSGF